MEKNEDKLEDADDDGVEDKLTEMVGLVRYYRIVMSCYTTASYFDQMSTIPLTKLVCPTSHHLTCPALTV